MEAELFPESTAQEILQLAKTWGEAKAEYYRFGREEYAHKGSPLYAKEHNLSSGEAAAIQQQVRSQLEALDDVEHKAQWALYEKVRDSLNGSAFASPDET